MNDLFLIAVIKSAYGSGGCVQIDSFSDFKERFFELKKVFVEIFGARKEILVEYAKLIDKKIVLKFVSFDSSDSVQALLGKNIYVDDEGSIKLSDDTFYIHDLIGSEVELDDELIGLIEDVLILPANDVLVVKDINNRRILIPAVKSFIKSFDAENKRLILVNGSELLYDDEI